MKVECELVCHHQAVAGLTENVLARKGLIQVQYVFNDLTFHMLFWFSTLMQHTET
jgi:hypothetical protein